jgi:hypothetical protein
MLLASSIRFGGLLVDDCELRSSKITQIQRQQSELVSRNQRRKILQNHFWKICQTSLNLLDPLLIPELLEAGFVKVSKRHPLASKKMFDLLIDHLCNAIALPGNLEHTKSTLEPALNGWAEDIKKNPHRCHEGMRSALELWGQTLDLKMQVAIVQEALDFVSGKMQRPILRLLVCTGLYLKQQNAPTRTVLRLVVGVCQDDPGIPVICGWEIEWETINE